MLKCDNLAWRPRAYLINERDLAQEKYSDLKRLLVPWRSFQGVSDGESADFLFNDAHHHHHRRQIEVARRCYISDHIYI